jgi:hypothetical protein
MISFNWCSAYENHLNSKKHKDLVLQFGEAEHEAVAKKTKLAVEAKLATTEAKVMVRSEWEINILCNVNFLGTVLYHEIFLF